MDPATYVTTLDDDALTALHKRLDASAVDDPATVEAHHLAATEMLKRGLDHGHDEDDPWSLAVIVTDQTVVKSADELGLPEGFDATPLEDVLKDGGTVSLVLTTNGYVMKAEPSVSGVHVDAIMGAYPSRRVEKRIVERDGKYVVMAEESDREFGTYDTREQAEERLAQIERFAKADGYDVPEAVQAAARKAKKWIADGRAGDGFTSVGRNRANQLAAGGPVGRDTLVKMRAYFARHVVDKKADGWGDTSNPTPGMVAWYAWGGDAGRAWANRVLSSMDKAYDPLDDVSDRDMALYESYNSLADEFGEWSPEDAHYMEADDNPFQEKGMHCANCVFYDGGGSCEILSSQVEAMGLCKLWIIPQDRLEGDEEELLETMDEDDLAGFGQYAADEDELEKAGNPEALRDYWRGGGKGKISWGAGGDFTACVAAVSKYMTDEQAKGYCAIRHREVTGMWPGAKANRANKAADAIDYVEDDPHVLKAVPVSPASTFTLPDGSVYSFTLPGDVEKGSRSEAGRIAARARWGNRGGDEGAAQAAGSPPPPSGPRRPGMGDGVPVSDEDFAELQRGSAGAHIIGRDENGSPIFSPERQALHDRILSEHVDGVPTSSDPTYHIMGGGPAAGKSSAIEAGIVDVPQGKDAVQINADDIKYRTDKEGNPVGTSLVDADKISGRKDWAAFTHEESSYIAKRITAAATERGQDMVLDGTGDNSANSVRGKIAGARAAGYTVKGHYVTCPTQMAVDRAIVRGEKKGRVVPEQIVRKTHAGVSKVVPEVATDFDSFSLTDTSGPTPVKVSSATKGGKIEIHDQALWDSFVAKGEE